MSLVFVLYFYLIMSTMIEYDYKVIFHAPGCMVIDDDGMHLEYDEVCVPGKIALPSGIKDPAEFLNNMSIDDEMEIVVYCGFTQSKKNAC